MLEDVRKTAVIVRRCAESDAEHFVLIVICHQEKACLRLLVFQHDSL